ncbi:HD domain-containing phosphohydrolase [Mariniblastus fucicola]|uniref:Hydrogenase transcriptional regulatory protein hupR1 n=1 Tax=Mariniblastus fucicola TaxID=980251 RepID=A0A5B9P342_9BACT|nr:HD domain-containing phosphohydrolase [Mariniblastus fucicola]QEG20798.1 Hydrogenase transcriptional regulatory protein hupR1 [Mariniblastus fucicola]
MSSRRILFVDDDEKVLKGITRQQADDFDITTALGPIEALAVIERDGPFAVVVSDMRMPEMNGVQLLKRVRESSPDTVRMILTGYAELNSTIEAVNEGHIFRFLAKPCDQDVMASALKAGLRQYELIAAEHELVEGTLHGSVKVLADILSLVNPLAFGQSTRVRAVVDGILKRVPIENQWQLEVAAMLSSLGCVTLPTDLLEKKLSGEVLTREEQVRYENHPHLTSELIQKIPRMDEVSAIISGETLEGSMSPMLKRKYEILRIAIAFDFHELRYESSLHALEPFKKWANERFEQSLVDALAEFVKEERNVQILEVELGELREGMVIAADIHNAGGTLLMSKGQKITASALRLLENIKRDQLVNDTVKIVSHVSACEAIC